MLTYKCMLCIYLAIFVTNVTKTTNIHLTQVITRGPKNESPPTTVFQNYHSTLQVHSANGNITGVQMHPTDTVLHFNRKMRDALGVPHDYGFLIIKDGVIMLSDYVIHDGNPYFRTNLVGNVYTAHPGMNYAVASPSTSSSYEPHSILQNYNPTKLYDLKIISSTAGGDIGHSINICSNDKLLDLHRKLRKALELTYNYGVYIIKDKQVIVGDYLNEENRELSECGIGPGCKLEYVKEKLGLFPPLRILKVESRTNHKINKYKIPITEGILKWTLGKVLFLVDRLVQISLQDRFISLGSSKRSSNNLNYYRIKDDYNQTLTILGFRVGHSILNTYRFTNPVELGKPFTLADIQLDIKLYNHDYLCESMLYHMIHNIPNEPSKLLHTPDLLYYHNDKTEWRNYLDDMMRNYHQPDRQLTSFIENGIRNIQFRFEENTEGPIRTLPIFLDGQCIFQIPLLDSYLQYRREIILPAELESYKYILMNYVIRDHSRPTLCKIITLDEEESADLKNIAICFMQDSQPNLGDIEKFNGVLTHERYEKSKQIFGDQNLAKKKLNQLLTKKDLDTEMQYLDKVSNAFYYKGDHYYKHLNKALIKELISEKDAKVFVLEYQDAKIFYQDGKCIICKYHND